MKKPSYYLNEIKTAQVMVHETWGPAQYTATLCEFFGDFFIVLTSYSRSSKRDMDAHSFADAEDEFDAWVKRNSVSLAKA